MGIVVEADLDLSVKNVLRFDTVSDEGILLTKTVIIEAAAFMMNLLAVETCIAGEGHRGVGSIDPWEIDYDYVSHLVTGIAITEEGIDASLRILPTPRGDVVRHWVENNDYRARMRTTHVLKGGGIMNLGFTTVDILPGI